MKYDFDKVLSREGTGALKLEVLEKRYGRRDLIPLWVADMDFETPPFIVDALKARLKHPIFGYTVDPADYWPSVKQWIQEHHQWEVKTTWLSYIPGVVKGIGFAINALTQPGDRIIIQTPVYHPFRMTVEGNHRQVVLNPLKESHGESFYEMDFEHLERVIQGAKLFLLCNPHNPAGRVWTREELEKMNNICMRHGVRVIADEIHCELVMPGHEYTPFASVSKECKDNCVALGSPSKAFNTAGLQIANIVCSNSELRRRIDRAINIFEVCDVNPFGPVALEAAYTKEGERWLEELNGCIWKNYQTLKIFLADNLPQIKVMELEGTYLAWLDIRDLGISSAEAEELLLEKGKLMLSCGTDYGQKAGEGYLRMNLACPPQLLEEGLKRMKATFAK